MNAEKKPLARLILPGGREKAITGRTLLALLLIFMIPLIGDQIRSARDRAADHALRPEITTAAIAGSDYAAAWLLTKYPSESLDYIERLADAGHPEGLWFRGQMQIHEGDASTGRANVEQAAKLGHPKAIRWLRDHPQPR